MFGTYDIGTSVAVDTFSLTVYRDGRVFTYERKSGSDIVLSTRISSASSFLVHPVEPVTQPKEISHHLLIQLAESLSLAPKSHMTCYVTFPIEIAVYVSAKGEKAQIDAFTLTQPKYTLYGTPEQGEVCKFWKSALRTAIPAVDPQCEGIMKVLITNTSHNWITLTKMVFDAYTMKIFFKDFAAMNATMEIISNGTARTGFVNHPLKDSMKKAVELFVLRKIPIVEKGGYLMEWGV
ncbi:MAG: DUF432 domain-containing protein [Theionarchaea archaeon]|nr:DUF432 domain-containing protein [Theionarchaea archaeon]